MIFLLISLTYTFIVRLHVKNGFWFHLLAGVLFLGKNLNISRQVVDLFYPESNVSSTAIFSLQTPYISKLCTLGLFGPIFVFRQKNIRWVSPGGICSLSCWWPFKMTTRHAPNNCWRPELIAMPVSILELSADLPFAFVSNETASVWVKFVLSILEQRLIWVLENVINFDVSSIIFSFQFS